jgi:hypothetical protein
VDGLAPTAPAATTYLSSKGASRMRTNTSSTGLLHSSLWIDQDGLVRLSTRWHPTSASRSVFAGCRFPAEVITVAVRWYLRYGLSYRDVEELLAERSVQVDHVTVYRWVQRFAPLFDDAARFARHSPGDRWFVDETYVKVNGRGTTCTGRSTSMGRSSTCSCQSVATAMPPGAFSAGR